MMTRPRIEDIPLNQIITEADTQARVETLSGTVARYVEVLANDATGEWPFEPVVVFRCVAHDDSSVTSVDGVQYFLADGFHRVAAAKAHKGFDTVPCRLIDGTADDARKFGMTANDTHGLPASRADKAHNLRWLMARFPDMTRAEQARLLGVSRDTVFRMIAAELRQNDDTEPAKRQKGDTEPAKRQKGDTEPAKRQKGDTEPAKRQDSDTEPAKQQDSDTEPAKEQDSDAGRDTSPALHSETAIKIVGIGRRVDAIVNDLMQLRDEPGGFFIRDREQFVRDAARTLKREIQQLAFHSSCVHCDGTGHQKQKPKKCCNACSGAGWIPAYMQAVNAQQAGK